MEAAVQEARNIGQLAKRNPKQGSLMTILGACWSHGHLAVEVLTKMQFVASKTTLMWCARLKLALSVLLAIRMLHQSNTMHCDFKPDQMGVDLQLNARFVDMDTLGMYPRGRSELFAGKLCKVKTAEEIDAEKFRGVQRPDADVQQRRPGAVEHVGGRQHVRHVPRGTDLQRRRVGMGHGAR